jgi:site-specific DNA-methyltransferase (adenine-specific)
MVNDLIIHLLPINKLKPDTNNARLHKTKSLQALCESLNKFGQRKPIVIKKDGTVVAGNGTYEAAKILGWQNINVVYIPENWNDKQIMAYALADNSTAELSVWDEDLLALQTEELKEIADLKVLGLPQNNNNAFDVQEIDDFDDEVIKVKTGQLWQLGKHRLFCGDVTDDATLNKLLNDKMIDCVWTDPPYGVSYVGKTAQLLTIENDDLNENDMQIFLDKTFKSLYEKSKPGCAYYICSPSGKELFPFINTLKSLNIWRHTLVWVKDSFVMGRSDYHYRHEVVLYGWKEGAAHKWVGDRKQDTVLEFERPKRSEEHPTMKPIKLITKMLSNSTNENDLICDPFGGSGSTLLAAEQINRQAYLCEINPKYCAVTISRWQNLTGEKAVLIND